MPTGFKSAQAGNAVPITGEAEMRVDSSGVDALTITANASMSTAANFLVLRGNGVEGSTDPVNERFVIGSSGQLSRFKYFAQAGSTGSTTPTLGASQSGQVWSFGGYPDGCRVLLPAPTPGLVFTIIQASANDTAGIAVSATRGASAEIRAPFRGSGLSTALVVGAPTTVSGAAAVFVAISSLTWQMFPAVNGVQGTSVTGEISGCWTSVAA